MPQEAGRVNDYRTVASGSPGLKDALRASSQPAGDKINDDPIPAPKVRVGNEKTNKIKP